MKAATTLRNSRIAMLFGILLFSAGVTAVYTRHESCGLQLNADVRMPNGTVINAEVSTSWPALERGLMERSSLPSGNGMLFVYPNVGRHRHWMYRCLIPPDIIWLSEEKRIVEITASAPPCSSKPCPSYGIHEASMYVLENGAGEAARMGLRIGDQTRFWPAGTFR